MVGRDATREEKFEAVGLNLDYYFVDHQTQAYWPVSGHVPSIFTLRNKYHYGIVNILNATLSRVHLGESFNNILVLHRLCKGVVHLLGDVPKDNRHNLLHIRAAYRLEKIHEVIFSHIAHTLLVSNPPTLHIQKTFNPILFIPMRSTDMEETDVPVTLLQPPKTRTLGPVSLLYIVQSSKLLFGSSQSFDTTFSYMSLNDLMNLPTKIFNAALVAIVSTTLPTSKGSTNHFTPLQDITRTFRPSLTNDCLSFSVFGVAGFKSKP